MSLRDALEERYDEIESEPEVAAPATEAPVEAAPEAAEVEPGETAAEQAQRARDEAGRFAKADKKVEKAVTGASPRTAPPAPAAAKAGGVVAPPTAAPPVQPTPIKPPQSWKPALRELAGKLPAEFHPLLEEVNRRERETAIALQRASEAGKGIQPWQETVRPYEAQIRAMGQEPHQYVGELLKTAHALTYGGPQDKAGRLADIIMQFQVPPADLDAALVARMQGRQMPQGAPQQAPAYQDPRVDKLLQALETQKAAREQAAAAEADSQVESFASTHDFFDDVAPQMQQYFSLLAQEKGRQASEQDWEDAYDWAVSRNPEVRAILEQRKAAKEVETRQAATRQAKAAASSIKSRPTAAPAAQPAGRRAALESAYDDLSSR